MCPHYSICDIYTMLMMLVTGCKVCHEHIQLLYIKVTISLIHFKQVLGISDKIKHFNYKGGVMAYREPFPIIHKLFWRKSALECLQNLVSYVPSMYKIEYQG